MHNKPSPLLQMLLRDLEETKKHLKEINQQLVDPDLFEKITEKIGKKSS